MGETVARLSDGVALHQQLANDAARQQAQTGGADQEEVTAAMRTQRDTIRGGGAQDEFTAPHLVLSSPAGIAASTPANTHLQSGEHVAATAGGNIALAAGKSFFASVAGKISLFAAKAGMKLFAARGKVEIQAQSDNIEVIAEQVLKLISTKASIEITAAKEILLNAGGSYLRINGQGIEHGTGGTWVAHAGQHKLEGPKNLAAVHQAEFERAQPKKFSQQVFVDSALWDLPSGARTLKYTFLSPTGQALGSGLLDGEGKSKPLFTESSEPTSVSIDVNNGKWEQLVFNRPPGVDVPDGAPEVVFDYDHQPEDEAAIDGPDDTITA